MADVLNRTTRELRRSVNTPEYDPAAWIVNPDLAAVADIEPKYWKLDGDSVLPMDESERAAADAAEEAAREEAIKQEALQLIEQPSGLRTVLQGMTTVMQEEIRALKRGTPREEKEISDLRAELVQVIESGAAS